MGDIDLLVHQGDRKRVDEVLRGLRGAAGFSLLDIRDHIFSPRSAERLPAVAGIPLDDFWERARPAQIEAVAALVFSPEDLLLHLALDLPMCPIGDGRVCRPRADPV